MPQDRRTFLATLGAAALSGSVHHAFPSLLAPNRNNLSRIGLQLYTVRKQAAADLRGTLARVSQIGYKEIEFAGYHNHPASEVLGFLDDHGLTAPSAHLAITQLENEPAKTFADAKTVGHQWLTVPSLSGKFETVDDWKRAADHFNKVAAQVKAAGFRFAYHNHNTEIRKIGDAVPLDILIDGTDPSLVSFEMDIYWVVNGGGDPLDLLARHPGRFKMLHVKDSSGPPDYTMVDVGAGTIDFKTIFARANGIEHYFVEHDNPPDAFTDVATSYRYLNNLTF
jgi:sugar phosphate isomerase/epimerase